jgi:hypothetical protein
MVVVSCVMVGVRHEVENDSHLIQKRLPTRKRTHITTTFGLHQSPLISRKKK